MRLTDYDLARLEQKYMLVQSNFENIVYVLDQINNVRWILDTETGQSIEVAGENVQAFAYEFLDVCELYRPKNNRKGGDVNECGGND